jgi:hypothetical protein
MSLKIQNEEYFLAVKQFAAKVGLLEQLEEKLLYLQNYAGGTCEAVLYKDFAPYSFEFILRKNGQTWFNGGLIYHGPHDNFGDGSAPTFSVSLGQKEAGWSIHT